MKQVGIASTESNLIWRHATVTRSRREKQNNHKSCVLWFTGLSGAGKSTVAHAVEERLHQMACRTFVLDGDNIWHGLSVDLGFCDEDRKENIRQKMLFGEPTSKSKQTEVSKE